MKHISKLILFSSFLAITFFSCKKNEQKDYFNGGTAPVLAASASGTIPLSYATRNNQAVTINWTNPEYSFTTGVSSLDVNYLLEIDTTGSNFTNPNKKQVSISKDLSVSFLVSDLNDFLLNQLVLVPGISHNIEMRVKAIIGNSEATALYSNVLKFTGIVPYAIPPKVNPPASGQLFLVGSATAGGWNNPVPVPSQQFTQVSTTLYTITVPLVGGQEYLFIPLNGDWTHKFACNRTTSPPSGETGGDFGYDWNDNFPGPGANGTYKIDVDFQRGKYTVTKL
jgi:starch-binding outer membrane protein SusE/F